MNPKVKDFPSLIRYLAAKHHGGHPHPMHERLGCSPALVQFWAKGSIKEPSLRLLEKLCRVYDQDLGFVLGLLRRPRTNERVGPSLLDVWKRDTFNRVIGIKCPHCTKRIELPDTVVTRLEDGDKVVMFCPASKCRETFDVDLKNLGGYIWRRDKLSPFGSQPRSPSR